MTRVLTLTSLYPPHHLGGAELSCHDVMSRLIARGHDVAVLCGSTRLPGVVDAADRGVFRELETYLRDGDPWSPPLRRRLAIERHNQEVLAEHLQRHRPEVVSVWHMGAMSLGLLALLGEQGVPIVYAACDEWPAYETKLDPWARLWWGSRPRRAAGWVAGALLSVPTLVGDLGSSGAFLWVSDLTRRRVIANTTWDYPCSTIVYSGIDTDVFHARRGTDRGPWAWRILYAGRFDPRKGVETAVRALAELPAEATLRLCGLGGNQERERLAALAGRLGIAERVSFHELTRDQLADAYGASDVVVFPSEWEEPFGLVPVEAMACGAPIIATGTGGSAEFLFEGVNYLRFPPGDAAALAAAIRRLASDDALRDRLVEAGRTTAAQLDVDRLTDVFEAWHTAAADRFVHGRPADRGQVRL
ncbi:MAG TPA: glycosyltransferase [Acidimicrobiales bacterium]